MGMAPHAATPIVLKHTRLVFEGGAGRAGGSSRRDSGDESTRRYAVPSSEVAHALPQVCEECSWVRRDCTRGKTLGSRDQRDAMLGLENDWRGVLHVHGRDCGVARGR